MIHTVNRNYRQIYIRLNKNKPMSKKLLITGMIILVFIGAISTYFITSYNKDPGPERTVSWDEAIEILNSGDVKEVFQSHSLNVTLILKDDTRINTIEPSIDDIFEEVERCGKPCDRITLSTE